jgi:hypothetical protein
MITEPGVCESSLARQRIPRSTFHLTHVSSIYLY